MNDQDEEALPWLDVDNLRRAAAADDDADVRGGHTAGWNRLDVVVERGRLLLSSSGEQHDWNIDDGPGNIFVSGRRCKIWTRTQSSDAQSAMT